MADFSKFRSALNGFNRADVVAYIESANREYAEKIRALEAEANSLREENESLRGENAALQAEVQSLQEENTSLIETLNQQTTPDDLSAEEAAEFEDVFDELEDTPAPVQAPEETAEEASAVSLDEQELAAYRRAEAAERNAVIRANKIHTQLGVLCDDARRRYSDSSDEISALTADLSAGLNRLNEAFAEIQLIFDDAENAFDELDLPEIED